MILDEDRVMADGMNTADETERFKRTLYKMCVFGAIMALNSLFSVYLFTYIAVGLGIVRGLDPDGIYVAQWIINDLAAYFFPILGSFILYRTELKGKINNFYGTSKALTTVIAVPAMFAMGTIATRITQAIANILDSLFSTGEIPDALENVAPETQSNFTVFFIFVCILGPILEEVIFRFLLLKPLRRGGDGFAVLISALAFGAYHGNFDQFPYTFAVGLCLGAVAVRTNSLIFPIILHLFNNTYVTISTYLPDVFGGENAAANAVSTVLNVVYDILYFIGIPTAVVLVALFATGKMFKRNYAYLTVRDKAKITFKNVAIYIFAASLVLLFVHI